ncbi:MAG: DUF6492 family protein [Pseudomonadota bacterium]
MNRKYHIVTIVYGNEINSLELQAHSIARFVKPDDVASINVIVNDIREESVLNDVRNRLSSYGKLKDRVSVVLPKDIICSERAKLGRTLKRLFVHNRHRVPFRVQAGWRGNNGWMMQQAFKLCAARLCDDGYVLILDAKNFFVAPVSAEDFVADDGRPRSFLEEASPAQAKWSGNARQIFGLPSLARDALHPPSTTPFVIDANTFAAAREGIESRLGPVECYFGVRTPLERKGSKASEFMLLHAYAEKAFGAWDACFAEGLAPAASINRTTTEDGVDAMIRKIERGESPVFSIHMTRLGTLPDKQVSRISALLREKDLNAPLDHLGNTGNGA